MATWTTPRSRTQSPHLNQFATEIPLREFKSNSSPVLCSTHLHLDPCHLKYRTIPIQKLEHQVNRAVSSASPVPQSTSSSAPQSRSSTPYYSAPPTPLSTGSDSSVQRRKRKPSLFKNFHFSVSSNRERSTSYNTARRDSLGAKSRRNTSASSTSSENGDLPSPPISPKSTAMPRIAWANDNKKRRRSRGYSASSSTRPSYLEEGADSMGFATGKSLPPLPTSGSRGRDHGSVTQTVPRCTAAHPADPFSVHPGTRVDFSTPEEPSFPYKRHSASSRDDADEYHAYLSSEAKDKGTSLPEWGRV